MLCYGALPVRLPCVSSHRCCAASLAAAFDDVVAQGQQFLLLPQRLGRAVELVRALMAGLPFGVHLSGPNGVGKSAALLLAFLTCAARGLPVAYVSRTEAWVEAAEKEDGGHAYLLKTFWRQNADLIAASPALRNVFKAVLLDGEAPFGFDVMVALREAVRTPGCRGLAIIVDEAQHITTAVVRRMGPAPSIPCQLAGDYFANNWFDWCNSNYVFQRMTAASAHAERDTRLPDGEAHRLRVMEPLDPSDRGALQEHAASPAFVHPAARQRVVDIAGNVLRKLVTAAELLPCGRVPTKTDLQAVWRGMWGPMVADCQRWLESLSEADRAPAARTAMDLVSGKVQWDRAKILYDAGIVYRTAASSFVRPVSAVAGAVVLQVLTAHLSATSRHLSSIIMAAERGYELERQVLARLTGFAGSVGTKLLDGSDAAALPLPCAYSLPFGDLIEVVPRDDPVLYRPIDSSYPCDGIVMPAAADAAGHICLVECSVTDPLLAARVSKVLAWFKPGGVVSQLQHAFPFRRVTVALCYDGVLPARATLSRDAAALSVGLLPPPLAASAVGVGAAGSTASAPSDGRSRLGRSVPASVAQPSAATTLGAVAAARASALGAVVRVVDGPFLRESLGVLV